MKAKKIIVAFLCTTVLISSFAMMVSAECVKYGSESSYCSTPMCTQDDANNPTKYWSQKLLCLNEATGETYVSQTVRKGGCC